MRFPTPIRVITIFLITALAFATLPAQAAANPVVNASAEDAEESRRLKQQGEAAFLSNDYAKAEALMRRLLAIQERTLGAEHNDTVRTLFFLGASLAGQGRRAEAEALNSRSASFALLYALNAGASDRALALLQQGANPNVHDARGRTALMYAGFAGQTGAMRKLLEMGAEVNAKMWEERTTALMTTVFFGDPEAIRLLLSKGADPNAKNAKGETALALTNRRLSNAPADRNVLGRKLPERTQFGDLSMATKKEFEEIIELLKKAGAGN